AKLLNGIPIDEDDFFGRQLAFNMLPLLPDREGSVRQERRIVDGGKEKKLAFGPYAVKKQLIRSNPARNLDGEFTPPETQHYPAL
ncbi:hypothetical protein MJN51_39825, partial [Salmonella enterica subsp. enterica serovar Kentucky]|nr:hypothetical protein [Salmonella enterica subsp. enterica serovar Kentucky]